LVVDGGASSLAAAVTAVRAEPRDLCVNSGKSDHATGRANY